MQQAVTDGTLSAGHARALAGLGDHAQQEALLVTISARGLSVRADRASRRDGTPGSELGAAVAGTRVVDPDVAHMEAQVREALGTKVTITPGRKGGRITIAWYDDEDLGRLVDRLTTLDR